ncbi:MAG TPA: SHOCT domain-containing protein [Stellaceae bacterium]|nr:SHOCT domain-containing protein [Stellaceae bacterium]
MAKSSVVVEGDIGAATRLCADAIKAAGGTVASSVPGEPIRFSIKRPGSWRDNRNTPYDGAARISAVNAAQSRVDVETTLAGIFYVYMGLTVVGCLLLTALFWYGFILPLIFAIIACIYLTVMAQGSWAQAMADAVVSRLTPAAHVAPQPPPSPPPAAAAAHAPSASVMEDLKKLGELHSSGVLTDAEFEGKKAELLKRV